MCQLVKEHKIHSTNMGKRKVFFNLTLLSLLTVLISIYFQDQLFNSLENLKKIPFFDSLESLKSLWLKNDEVKVPKRKDLFTPERLALHDGVQKKTLYLSVLGAVFDVTQGKNHYKPGTSYYYFIAKDGSRAFATGDFADLSADKDNVLTLNCDELLQVLHWKNTFQSKYKKKGKLIGRFYDETGVLTPYGKEVKEKIEQCNAAKEAKTQKSQQYPPCNSEWNANDGTRVWCSQNSGGVTRNWEGVPRQLVTSDSGPSCVCVDFTKKHPGVTFKEYDNCPPTATSCNIGNIP